MIRLHQKHRSSRETEYITQALEAGHLAGDGPFTFRCQSLLEEITGSSKVLLTTSCTHALEMAALLLNIAAGDEVIVPSFTFVSTINAFVLRGARPVFVDIRRDTLNIDERQVENAITSRTKAVVPVHYAGVGCEMNALLSLAQKHNLTIVEDNAHGLLGKYAGRPLGSFGTFATLSFHETKNFTCGEGGALLINDERFIERAEILREKGTQRSRVFRGELDKYTWCDIGSSYVLSDVLAALLLAQLEEREAIQQRRREVWESYSAALAEWARSEDVQLPLVPAQCEQAYHMFYLLLPSSAARTALVAHLRLRGVLALFHYLPLHLSPMGRAVGGREGDCPVTEDVSERLLRLPLHPRLSGEEVTHVIESVLAFACAVSDVC